MNNKSFDVTFNLGKENHLVFKATVVDKINYLIYPVPFFNKDNIGKNYVDAIYKKLFLNILNIK